MITQLNKYKWKFVLRYVVEQIDMRLRELDGVEFVKWNEKNLVMAKTVVTDHFHMHLYASLLVKIFGLKEHIPNIYFQHVFREYISCKDFLTNGSSRLGVTFWQTSPSKLKSRWGMMSKWLISSIPSLKKKKINLILSDEKFQSLNYHSVYRVC